MPEGFDPRLPDLMRAIDDFGQACTVGDIERLRAHLSPDYTHNDPNGAHLTRGPWLAKVAWGSNRPGEIGIHGVTTRIFGDVAVITGVGTRDGGGPMDGDDGLLAFTQVWHWDGARWMREAYQATQVMPEAVR